MYSAITKIIKSPHKHKDTTCILQSKELLFLQISSFFCFLHVVHSYPLFILFQIFRAFYYITATYCSAIIFSRHVSMTNTLVNYSATELPEHLNRGGIPPFSGCVHDTTTVYSFELYSYFYDFRCFQSGHGQFFFYSGYGEIFSQDIICTDSIRIIILASISV